MEHLLTARIDKLFYQGNPDVVLRQVFLDLCPGEFVRLEGPSGSGKSVLCRCLAGIIPLFESATLVGEVLFRGRNLSDLRLPQLAGEIGFVGHDPQNQLFCATLKEDLAFGPCSLLLEPSDIENRVKSALPFVGLTGYENRTSETLSGGEIRRAALASAWILDPKLIILDCSFDQIDARAHREICHKLAHMCSEKGKTVLLVDETSEICASFVQRTITMEKGTVVYDGKINRFSSCVPGYKRGSRGSIIPESAAPVPPETDQASTYPLISSKRRQPRNCSSDPVISVKGLCFTYPESGFALEDISFDVYRGEFVAIVGENGAGKTTLIKHLNGLLRPSAGEVIVNGLAVKDHTPAQMSDHVGYLLQDPLMQVCANTVRGEVGFALKAKGVPPQELAQRVDAILTRLDLVDVANVHPYRLPRSELQRAALASCLVSEPEILVVDEPTSAMGYPQNWETLELLSRISAEGTTILMITHDRDVAGYFCHRTIVMKKGRIEADTAGGRGLEAGLGAWR
jgi:energy-coupling factor transport system ATP-binding protein